MVPNEQRRFRNQSRQSAHPRRVAGGGVPRARVRVRGRADRPVGAELRAQRQAVRAVLLLVAAARAQATRGAYTHRNLYLVRAKAFVTHFDYVTTRCSNM